ncbi:hypothetical protein [Sodalis-like endosymbiont of Proechinophthirus fluctus]|uniref:hypothetical protein n=1 Tax=Sodalis-like endosymbiont of Proechinophthirus fluctus TaxID=1462730 RepID=UPI000836A0FA|nr:hypothetical protein [Sodalis-like endosymbiont of Proechinophthirus fluctus]
MNTGRSVIRMMHGLLIGIILLDTIFERLSSIPHTWPFPVQFHVMRSVSPADVITSDPPTRR